MAAPSSPACLTGWGALGCWPFPSTRDRSPAGKAGPSFSIPDHQLAPKADAVAGDKFDGRFNRGGLSEVSDVTTELQSKLDVFDVQMVPFGWVALFIVLYIIVVGPLDYVILRFVFKRLEWTWFTFPTVVLVVSVAAYFTAYALEGQRPESEQGGPRRFRPVHRPGREPASWPRLRVTARPFSRS